MIAKVCRLTGKPPEHVELPQVGRCVCTNVWMVGWMVVWMAGWLVVCVDTHHPSQNTHNPPTQSTHPPNPQPPPTQSTHPPHTQPPPDQSTHRYLASQEYKQHFDAFDLGTEDGRRFAENGGQRVATVRGYVCVWVGVGVWVSWASGRWRERGAAGGDGGCVCRCVYVYMRVGVLCVCVCACVCVGSLNSTPPPGPNRGRAAFASTCPHPSIPPSPTPSPTTTQVLIYLNDVGVGGKTIFPRLHLSVTPTKGMALVFFPATLDGRLDEWVRGLVWGVCVCRCVCVFLCTQYTICSNKINPSTHTGTSDSPSYRSLHPHPRTHIRPTPLTRPPTHPPPHTHPPHSLHPHPFTPTRRCTPPSPRSRISGCRKSGCARCVRRCRKGGAWWWWGAVVWVAVLWCGVV